MKTIIKPERDQWPELCLRPEFNPDVLEKEVMVLLNRIRIEGVPAINEFTEKFDGYLPSPMQIGGDAISRAGDELSPDLKKAINVAAENIRTFHRSQLRDVNKVDISLGVRCWQKDVPIDSVGLYIPGGTAPLFSTVLMLGIPATIAGCSDISLCTPAGKDGEIHPAILYAASLCGIDKVYRIGGVQAIGAMAYGIALIPKADKIFGPGNQYVTMAKQIVSRQTTAIDMPAGPSEVLVMADETANPGFVAADLISQAEHGSDSQVILLCRSRDFASQVQDELDIILQDLPRAEMAKDSLKNSKSIVFETNEKMLDFSNVYAPEHLIISVKDAGVIAEKVKNAGSVFIGNYSPESVGDYASGTNHTLPTNGYAKAYSGITTQSFMKTIQFQELTSEGLEQLGPVVEKMAKEEGLDGHALAVSKRLNKIRNEKI